MYLFILLSLLLALPTSWASSEDYLPWDNLTQLAQLEQTADYSIKVIVLTMNRPQSLLRLLRSINRTYFEYPGDRLEVEIHVDRSHGLYYQDCVNIAQNFTLPPGRGTVKHRIAKVTSAYRFSIHSQSQRCFALIGRDGS